ncbi:FKBP-type peptidyl-prolyl cis-trans isomerase [Candidatus Pacearchaeota archaeon]|nr:FKBP-type peptidyl-prolyl cis-trans isomerase [Candidatus Pacearchaeota archaeon]
MVVKEGNVVVVDYEGRFESGEIFDSSKHGDHSHPLEFEVSAGNVISGFDRGVLDMEKGEEKEIVIEPDDAYGNVNKSLYKEIPRESLQLDQDPEEDMGLLIATPDGKQFPTKIVEVSDKTITIDLNHPLAGKTLIFKIKIIEIKG